MFFSLIGARLHGWLDDLVTLTYIGGALLLGLSGWALVLALAGAAVHFALTRLTDYPQGTWRVIPFAKHAYIELAEGLGVLAGTALLTGSAPASARILLGLLGASQLVAFGFSDYRWPRQAPHP
jgi:hypothetical protein